MKLNLITFVFAAVLMSSCGPTKSLNTSPNNSNMDNMDAVSVKIPTETFWKLETLEGKDYSKFKNEGNEIGFTMFADNNRISGYAGCNNFFGTYRVEPGNKVQFSSIGATKMACPEGSFNENEFLQIFSTADSYKVTEDRLELKLDGGATLATFTKGTLPEPITEKYWKLKTLEGKTVTMKDNQEREIFFILKTDGNRVNGFAGCNSISGEYKLKKGNRIRFSNMATTMMACPDVDVNESEFLKVFELADNYTINGDELTLNVGRRAPLAVFEAVYME